MTWPAIPRPDSLQCALRQVAQHIDASNNGCPPAAANEEMNARDLGSIKDWNGVRNALTTMIDAIDKNSEKWGPLPHCNQHGTGEK
ncbi:MAG: hypothetical protein M3126_06750 [Candidatus Eremiobacteraeota bacterium]|nr:hypothetical protein [Candidatus Eremiobacteraeota bacterium]